MMDHERGIGRQPRLAAELPPAILDQETNQASTEHHQNRQAQQQHARRGQVDAFGDVPLLPGLLPAMGRRIERFIAGLFGHRNRGQRSGIRGQRSGIRGRRPGDGGQGKYLRLVSIGPFLQEPFRAGACVEGVENRLARRADFFLKRPGGGPENQPEQREGEHRVQPKAHGKQVQLRQGTANQSESQRGQQQGRDGRGRCSNAERKALHNEGCEGVDQRVRVHATAGRNRLKGVDLVHTYWIYIIPILEEILGTLRETRIRYFILAVSVYLLSVYLFAVRWQQALFCIGYDLKATRLVPIYFGAIFMNNITPARYDRWRATQDILGTNGLE